MNKVEDFLIRQLEQRELDGAYRRLPVSPPGLIDFCSNDYLGYARDPSLWGVQPNEARLPEGKYGASGSRLITGNSSFTEDLEQELALFHQAPAGLIFTSGYTANVGLLSAVATRHDTILYDQLAHASIRDGISLSKAHAFSFRHNDPDHLRSKLHQVKGRAFIVVESVYSMDGDEAPLEDLLAAAQDHGAALIVDEAHATGVFGPKGEGLVVEKGLEEAVWARIYTFGKALGGHGALVVGSTDLREYLINFSRPFIYSTALPFSVLLQVKKAYAKMAEGLETKKLRNIIDVFLQQKDRYFPKQFLPSRSAIQCLICPGNETVKKLAGTLQEKGVDVRPILHPTVPKGQERLRICLHAFNTVREIEELGKILKKGGG